ncbi:MAG: phosphoglycerate dehydrogenase, partial [Byssovorax sp.]
MRCQEPSGVAPQEAAQAWRVRILNVHRNVPGVLRDVTRIVSDLDANIEAQFLSTDATIGYLIMDLSGDVSAEVTRRIAALETNIRTRVLY